MSKNTELNFIKFKKFSLQFLPESLEDISNKKTIEYKNIKLKSSYLIDIIHSLLLKYYFKKENIFNLSSTILKSKYGHNYNFYIDYLVENKHLLMVRNYQKGKNARVYSLNDSIIINSINRYQNTDKFLLKKYQTSLSLYETDSKNKIELLIKKKLIKDLYSVNVDYSKSIFYLDTLSDDLDVYNKNKYSVESIKDNHIFYHFDEYGRFHTNFTILKSYIRKNCLLIDDEETCEIDIPNSQPLFLYKLISENDINIVNKKELERFKELTITGKFYKYCINNNNIKKKEMKEIIYKVFFGKNFKNEQNNFFEKLFPTIHRFIKEYKSTYSNYRMLAYDLQKMESNLIFNKVIKKIMQVNPSIKIITVHDSIICNVKYKDEVKSIFNAILNDEFDSKEFNI